MRCTNATVEALGCPADHLLIYGTSVLEHLTKNGYTCRPVFENGHSQWTLGDFIKTHPTGFFVLSGVRHSMALVNGQLIDTAKGGMRRKVIAIQVWKNI